MTRSPRLYIDAALTAGTFAEASLEQAHYLLHVLRLKEGETVRLFNGRDGEWPAKIERGGKKKVMLRLEQQNRPQTTADDVFYLFAPLKHARLDYMAQKATEMGVSRFMPVITQKTQVSRLNIERLRANAVEAAEQCELLHVPDVASPQTLDACLADWPQERTLIFCDEGKSEESPYESLLALKGRPCAVLVGPEGGFTKQERQVLLQAPFTLPISLGPRILRADTAAVAALAMLWQARN